MKLLDAYRVLSDLKQPVLRTLDVAACLGVSRAYGSKIMTRLSESGYFAPLSRGKYLDLRAVSPLEIPEYLMAPFPSYISLQSALFHHGMISQIPAVSYSVTTGRSKRFDFPQGAFSFHHVEADFFFGFENFQSSMIKMATPEKALLDFFYLSPGRSRLFKKLPELELPRGFNFNLCRDMAARIRSQRRRSIVDHFLEELRKSR